LLNQDSAVGIYKTFTETQRGFYQHFEREHSVAATGTVYEVFGHILEV